MKKFYQNLKTTRAALMMLLMGIFVLISIASNAQEVTITTDKDDYSPGEWVIITGSGWEANEFVVLSITHTGDFIPDHTHEDWEIQADEKGDIYDKWYVEEQELGTTLWLQAWGQSSGWYAEVTFTDAKQTQIINVGPSEGICGEQIEVTAQLQSKQGNASWDDVAGEIITFAFYENDPTQGNPIALTTETGTTDANGVATATIFLAKDYNYLEATYEKTQGGDYQSSDNSIEFSLTTNVSNAGPITGSSAVCANETGVTYSIDPIDGALTYTWSVPSGATIASGQGTTNITFDFGETSGDVKVTPSNGCSSGTPATLAVAVNSIDPGEILKGANPGPECGSLNPYPAGTVASESTDATGAGTITYQWESTTDGTNWIPLPMQLMSVSIHLLYQLQHRTGGSLLPRLTEWLVLQYPTNWNILFILYRM